MILYILFCKKNQKVLNSKKCINIKRDLLLMRPEVEKLSQKMANQIVGIDSFLITQVSVAVFVYLTKRLSKRFFSFCAEIFSSSSHSKIFKKKRKNIYNCLFIKVFE